MAGYLFAHFIGEQRDGEQVYFSLSKDGLHWKDLYEGKPVLISEAGEKGARDPFLIRDEANNRFYLIATDLRIEAGKGWGVAQYEGSRKLFVWRSEDLVNWSEVTMHEVGVEGAGCVWAPESIYDVSTQEFLVFWASMIKLEGDTEPKQRIYASYTKDFNSFSEPFVYYEAENHIIDTTIVYDKGWYYRFSKDETTKNIRMEKSESLDKDSFIPVHCKLLDELIGVEGPECYRLPDGRWCLIVDRFATGKGYLPLICSELALADFAIAEDYDLGVNKKRHGGVLELTDEEYERLSKFM